MKKALIVVCIVVMASAWGCATEHCARRTFWTDFAQWFQLDEAAQRRRATRYVDDPYWPAYFDLDAKSLGYWGGCQ